VEAVDIEILESNPYLLEEFVEETGKQMLQSVEAAAYRPLNRYSVLPGKFFGPKNPKSKDRFKILELSGNIVGVKDLTRNKTTYENIDTLLDQWNELGYVEITTWDRVLDVIKRYLTPFLGPVVVSALLAWLIKKLR
jgi:hypothetical protein